MTTTIEDARLGTLIEGIGRLVADDLDEHRLTQEVAALLRQALADGIDLPAAVTRPGVEHYVTYPLHIDPEGRFSIATAIWDVGQSTPVHGHETWGVVGIHSGVEHEVSYTKPRDGEMPVREGEASWTAGQVTVCCTTDDDVHQVSCGGPAPCVGIHVYGADLSTLPRRTYSLETGEVAWFTSTWTLPDTGA